MAVAALYGAVLWLEVHWNLFSWSPSFDYWALAPLSLIPCLLGAQWLLANRLRGTWRWAALAVAALLACPGLYTMSAEPLGTDGLFPRTQASPLWYRGTRCFILLLPGVFILLARAGDKTRRFAVTTQ